MVQRNAGRVQNELDKLAQRKAQITAQERKLRAQLRVAERKERNSRLIRISAELFAMLERDPEEKDVVLMHRLVHAYPEKFKETFNAELQSVSAAELSLLRGEEKERFSTQPVTQENPVNPYTPPYAYEA